MVKHTKFKYGRVDNNHKKIVEELRARGCYVTSLANVGKGVPDILVGYKGVNYLFEIKDPEKPPSARKLTPDEIKWHDEYKGQVDVILTSGEAWMIINNTP